jgi:hypothetical protein
MKQEKEKILYINFNQLKSFYDDVYFSQFQRSGIYKNSYSACHTVHVKCDLF